MCYKIAIKIFLYPYRRQISFVEFKTTNDTHTSYHLSFISSLPYDTHKSRCSLSISIYIVYAYIRLISIYYEKTIYTHCTSSLIAHARSVCMSNSNYGVTEILDEIRDRH